MSKTTLFRSLVFLFLTGCAYTPEVSVEVSDAIFLNTEDIYRAPLYVHVRNQTELYDAGDEIYKRTIDLLHKKGFETTRKAKEAEYRLTAVLLNIRKESKKLNLGQAFALTAGGAGIGAIAGRASSYDDDYDDRGRNTAIGAGVGAGAGLLGFAIANMVTDEHWYGTVEVEIIQPEITKTSIITERKEEEMEINSNKDTLGRVSTTSKTIQGTTRRNTTKILIRVSSPNINKEDATEQIVKAVSHKLANFF